MWANVTPDLDAGGQLTGFYSVRRRPNPEAIRTIVPLYREMLNVERSAGARDAPDASLRYLLRQVEERGLDYERFVIGLK